MSMIRELMDSDKDLVTLTGSELKELITEALDEVTGESEEDDPITAFSISRSDGDMYEFGISYTGWNFEGIYIRIKEEE